MELLTFKKKNLTAPKKKKVISGYKVHKKMTTFPKVINTNL